MSRYNSLCTSTTGVPFLHLIACFHKVYRNLLLQSHCASEEYHCNLPAGSEHAESRTGTTLTSTRHGYVSAVSLVGIKTQTGLQGNSQPAIHHRKCWHIKPRTLPTTLEQALPCSPGAALYTAKLLTFQHLFGFYTKASQGPVMQNIFVDISVPGRAALLWLCISHLWLCQK